MTEPEAGSPEIPESGSSIVRAAAPGLFRLSIEGRRAPALFVTGWIAVILGLGTAIVGYLASGSVAGSVLFAAGLAGLTVGLFLLGGSQTVERQAAGLAYAGPSPVLVFVTTLTTSYVAAIAVGVPLELLGVRLERAAADVVAVTLQLAVFVGVVRVMVVAPGAISWREMGFGQPLARVLDALGWGMLLAVPVVVVTGLVASVLVSVLGVSPESPLPPTGTSSGFALHLLAGAILAPIGEEVFFRGVAATAWSRSVGPTGGVVRSSILHALAHVLLLGGATFGQAVAIAIVAAAGRLPIAFALGWAYMRRGTIWASIGMHAAFNAILIVLSEIAIRNLTT